MINNKINYKLVDTAGQITAVVFNVFKENNLALISQKLMQGNKMIEQVVFISKNKIQTMGNELCINGSLAGAYLMNKKELRISGVNKPIKFIRNKNFENRTYLKSLANKYNVPASGVVKYKVNKITPIVYVKATNTLVQENACGSGSLVYSIYSNYSKIIQPSNRTIYVWKYKKSFTVKVPVKIVE